MDICLELSYDIFIADEMLEQARLERYVNETLLMAEGTNTISNMTVIVEAFADKFKEVIKKIVNAIINVWHKFLEGINTLIKSDKGYLEKYKDTILKKQVRIGDITMPNYEAGMNDILNKRIPAFNYEGLKSELAEDKEKGTFKQKFYNDYKPENDFSEFVKNKLKGGEKDLTNIKGSQLKMTNMYNYCYNFDKLAKNIESEITNINKVGNQAIGIIDQKVRNTPQTEAGLYETAKYFSYVYESFIHEVEIGNDGSNKNQQQQTNTQQNKSQQDNNAKYNQSQVDGEHDNKDKTTQNLSGESAEEATQNIQTYINVCGQFLAAKMTIARNCYKDYMAIIKAHVRSYTGDAEASKNTENNKQKDEDTNANPPQPPKKEKTNPISNFFDKIKKVEA